MISSIEITRFRGIREGKLEDLAPLTVLVGANGCGKSTVLDGLLIGAKPAIGEGIGEAVVRHQGVRHGTRWLFWRAAEQGEAEIVVETSANSARQCRLLLINVHRIKCMHQSITAGARSDGKLLVDFPSLTDFSIPKPTAPYPLEDVPDVHVVEWLEERIRTPLDELLTECSKRGQRGVVKSIVADLVPGLQDVLILTEDGAPIVYLELADYSVPAALAGDGIHSLLRISLELAARPNGVVLLEEPEVHQHPGAIRQTIRVILAAVRRNIQVVLTTHSLELIDALLAESSDEDLEKLALYRMELDDGRLISARMTGPEVAFSRIEIENDLR